LVAYTEFGLRHVNAALLAGLIGYAWFAAVKGREDLDRTVMEIVQSLKNGKKIRRHFPWLLLFLFALQGVAGMVPAIYTDVDDTGKRCIKFVQNNFHCSMC